MKPRASGAVEYEGGENDFSLIQRTVADSVNHNTPPQPEIPPVMQGWHSRDEPNRVNAEGNCRAPFDDLRPHAWLESVERG